LGDILVLDREILTNSTPTACGSGVLRGNGSEVFALAFLRKGDSSGIRMDNTSIKLEIMVKSEGFTLLSQELSLMELQLLCLCKIVSSDEQGIVSLKADDSEGLLAVEEARVVSRLFHGKLVNIVGMVSLEPVVPSFRYAI
jgi:hypothetical protein